MKNLMLALGLILLVFPGSGQTQEEVVRGTLVDRIVAVVDDDVIMQSELESEAEQLRGMLLQRGSTVPPEDYFQRQVLERMISTQLQVQFAERAGIRVTDDRLNVALAEIASRNGVSLSDLPARLAKEEINYTEFREQLRKEMLTSEVQRRISDESVSVSQREVDEFLARQKRTGGDREYLASQILIAVPGEADPQRIAEGRERIEEIRQEALDGKSFSELAAAYSDGQQALEGGSLGWRKLAEMPTLFADVVDDMKKGDVSAPIRSGSGWHLVHLDDVRGGQERVLATETHARHILLKPNAVRDEAATMKLAEELKARLKAGEDFATLAKEYSEDPGSKAQGGDLEWQPPGVFAPRFQEVLDGLEPNQVSDPFKTQFGIHVAQVLERRETDFTENVEKNRAYMAIKRRKAEEQFPIWLQKQRDDAHIEIRL